MHYIIEFRNGWINVSVEESIIPQIRIYFDKPVTARCPAMPAGCVT